MQSLLGSSSLGHNTRFATLPPRTAGSGCPATGPDRGWEGQHLIALNRALVKVYLTRLRILAPALAWAALIMVLSGHVGAHENIVRRVVAVLRLCGLGLWGDDVSGSTLEELLLYLRKPAHVFLYAVLALLAQRSLKALATWQPMKLAIGALVFCALCAIIDETHQALAGDRSGLASDVATDVVAAAAPLLIILARGRSNDRQP